MFPDFIEIETESPSGITCINRSSISCMMLYKNPQAKHGITITFSGGGARNLIYVSEEKRNHIYNLIKDGE